MDLKFGSKHIKSVQIRLAGILLLVCLLVIALCSATYAIFTSVRSAQRTIAAYDTEGDRFSSNYLLKGESKDNVRTVYTTNSAQPTVAAVTVCNFQQGRETLPFADTITYTLTARLVKYDESSVQKYVPVDAAYLSGNSLTGYTVSVSDDTTTHTLGSATLSTSFTKTLPGASANTGVYTISFSSDFAANKPNLYLEMVAVPDTVMLPTLRGIFKPDLRAAGATDFWEGSFRDDSSSTPASYDGYNYQITGTGAGTFTVTWDSTKVVLSDVSRDLLLSVSGATESGSSITFPVDSDVESRYEVQFYKKNITSETWQQMETNVITFSFS